MIHLQTKLFSVLIALGGITMIAGQTSCAHKSGHRREGALVTRSSSKDSRQSNSTSEKKVSGNTRVRMTKENGVYYVPITVNGLSLRFIFDTGASSILISSAEAAVMIRQGLIEEDDILGQNQMEDASGNISTGTVVNLKSVVIGDLTLHNVEATVVDNIEAPLLFGQTALSKFGKVSIDYDHGYIEFN